MLLLITLLILLEVCLIHKNKQLANISETRHKQYTNKAVLCLNNRKIATFFEKNNQYIFFDYFQSIFWKKRLSRKKTSASFDNLTTNVTKVRRQTKLTLKYVAYADEVTVFVK